jgi:hypothetical protein
MKNNYKTINYLLLLGTLSFCWHSNTLAREMDFGGAKVNPDKLEKKTRAKRNNDEESLSTHDNGFPIKQSLEDNSLSIQKNLDFLAEGLPDDTIRHISHFFDFFKDRNALLALSTADTRLHALIENEYVKANENENHCPWQVMLFLPKSLPSTLYILNTRMRTILGLYVNIKNDWANNIDRVRFERLCSPFITTPLFLENTLPVRYIELLQLDLSVRKPTPFQILSGNLSQDLLQQKKETCSRKLSRIASQQDSKFQNEGALYFHYCQSVKNMMPAELERQQNSPVFENLNNSLMTVMNKELLTLKRTPNLSGAGNFAPTWKKILSLEPAITIWQSHFAGCSYFHAGQSATDSSIKFTNFTKAIECRENELESIIGTGQTPTADDYHNIAIAYVMIGQSATDSSTKSTSYTKMAGYREKELKSITDTGQALKACYYGNIAEAYCIAGRSATDSSTKFTNFTKAAEYREKELEKLEDDGQTPTADQYTAIARAYFEAGKIASDSHIKIEDFIKARTNFEACLKLEVDEKKVQLVNTDLQEISIFLADCHKTTFDTTVGEQPLDG